MALNTTYLHITLAYWCFSSSFINLDPPFTSSFEEYACIRLCPRSSLSYCSCSGTTCIPWSSRSTTQGKANTQAEWEGKTPSCIFTSCPSFSSIRLDASQSVLATFLSSTSSLHHHVVFPEHACLSLGKDHRHCHWAFSHYCFSVPFASSISPRSSSTFFFTRNNSKMELLLLNQVSRMPLRNRPLK